MDHQTALILALQLVALFSIAGALLLYLLCKIRANNDGTETNENIPGASKPILVTSCDNAIGLQIAIHLANRGFRVFAGLKDGMGEGAANESVPAKVLKAWQKFRESNPQQKQGAIVALPLDVTREDLLHEAVDIIRAHLPAGEDGIWAVINTNGLTYRGKLDQQDISHWDAILKTNLVGVLRTARTFQGLLRNTGGRIITFGAVNEEAGLVAYTAARYGVEGASKALRQELAPVGIKVVTLNPQGLTTDLMFATPKLSEKKQDTDISLDMGGCMEFYPIILTTGALEVLDIAISAGEPKENYTLVQHSLWYKTLNFLNIV